MATAAQHDQAEGDEDTRNAAAVTATEHDQGQCVEATPGAEEGSSTALLQSTQTDLFHASTTRSTDAACSSDDSAFLCGFESVHAFAKNKAVLRHYYY